MFQSLEIRRLSFQGEEVRRDLVAEEIPFTINVNDRELVTLLASPAGLKDLAVGFLFSSGLIRRFVDIEAMVVDAGRGLADVQLGNKQILQDLVFKRMWTSGCGRGAFFYNSLDALHREKLGLGFKVEEGAVFALMEKMQGLSQGFRKTGGVHCAGLSLGKDIDIFREDIGRHNALDKVLGAAIRKKMDFSCAVILSSGRLSSEIVLKVKKSRAPIIASPSAPTDQAVRLSRSLGMTLLGFVRGKRMNIYSGGERILSNGGADG